MPCKTPDWQQCRYCQMLDAPEPPRCLLIFSYDGSREGRKGYCECCMAFGACCKYFAPAPPAQPSEPKKPRNDAAAGYALERGKFESFVF